MITPVPGFVLTRNLLPSEIPGGEQFTKITETPGELKRSKVLSVGADLTDDHGNIRKPHCEVGDIIYHAPAADDFILDNLTHHLVHFSNIRGIYESK